MQHGVHFFSLYASSNRDVGVTIRVTDFMKRWSFPWAMPLMCACAVLALQPVQALADAPGAEQDVAAAMQEAAKPVQQSGLLSHAIRDALERHDQMRAARSDVEASRQRIRETLGTNWFPALSLTTNTGYERIMKKDLHAETELFSREVDVTLTQRLMDFGQGAAATNIMRATHRQMVATLDFTEQTLALEAISAYYNLVRAIDMLDYADQSVQTSQGVVQHEESLMAEGSGDEANLLLARTQMVRAESMRVTASGDMKMGENRVRAIFKRPAKEIIVLRPPRLPSELRPESVEDALRIATVDHPQVQIAKHTLGTMEATKKSVIAANFPTILGYVDAKYKQNVSGTVGYYAESNTRVEMTFPLNLGGTAFNSHRAAVADQNAATRRLDDSRIQVEKGVRDAWDRLITAEQNEKLLTEVVKLSEENVALAQRQLAEQAGDELMVLNARIALLASKSAEVAAKSETATAFYGLLYAMGQLSDAVFSRP